MLFASAEMLVGEAWVSYGAGHLSIVGIRDAVPASISYRSPGKGVFCTKFKINALELLNSLHVSACLSKCSVSQVGVLSCTAASEFRTSTARCSGGAVVIGWGYCWRTSGSFFSCVFMVPSLRFLLSRFSNRGVAVWAARQQLKRCVHHLMSNMLSIGDCGLTP